MKRISLLFAFAFVFSSSAFSQTDKGWRSVGGTGSLRLDFKNKSHSFGLNPEMYWFVGNSFALGTDFGFGLFASKANDSTSLSSINTYITLGARFYFRDPEKKWRPYVFGNGGFETMASHTKIGSISSNSKGSGFRGYAGLGMAWFFNEHAAFDMRLHLIDYGLDNSLSPLKSDIQFNPTISIGIQAFFHHE